MDSERFDNLIRRLETTRVTRGGVLRGVVASAMAAVAGAALLRDTDARKKRGKSRVKSQGAKAGKVTICHFTHSETNPYSIITVSRNSVQEQSHLSHGDFEYDDCCLDSECSLPDGVDPQCNEAFCDQGTCGTRFLDVACDDDNLCTENDHCVEQGGVGVCAGTPKNCDDGDTCTDDSCNAASGECVHTDNGTCSGQCRNEGGLRNGRECTLSSECERCCCVNRGASFVCAAFGQGNQCEGT